MGVHMFARCGRRCDRFSTIEKRWCRMPHTVCESAEERWRDGAGCLPTSGDTRVLVSRCQRVCMCVRLLPVVYLCACARPWVRACGCVRVNVHMRVLSEMKCGKPDAVPEPVVSGGKPDPRDFALQICFSEHCRWSTRHILSNENRFRCCKSVGKRWCDVAGGLLTLGFRSPMLARMLA